MGRTSADVETKVHLVLVVLDAIVVALNVRVEQLIRGLCIRLVLNPSLQHLLRAEI